MRALVFLPEDKGRKRARRVAFLARLAGLEPMISGSSEDARAAALADHACGRYFLLVTDARSAEFARTLVEETAYCRTILLESQGDRGVFASLPRLRHIKHVLGVPDDRVDDVLLLPTLQRLSGGGHWPLARYFADAPLLRSHHVLTHTQAQAAVASLQAELASLGKDVGDERFLTVLTPKVVTACEELLANAVFAAHPDYRHADPRKGFSLGGTEGLTLEWGMNGRRMGVAVSDRCGSLTPNVFFESVCGENPLAGSPLEEQRSAGIGLKTVAALAQGLVASVSPAFRTTLTAFFELERDAGRGDLMSLEYFHT